MKQADTSGSIGTAATAADSGWPTDFHGWTITDVVPGSWTSPWHEPRHRFTALTVSWQADTPGDSWISVELQVRTPMAESSWMKVGDWAFETTAIKRQTVNRKSADSQDDRFHGHIGRVLTDAFEAADEPPGGTPSGYRVRVTLHASPDTVPVLRQVAVATANPGELPDGTSVPLRYEAVELPVPRYSQSVHRDEYPEFGGGGQVWCSPASTSMVMTYWGVHPSAEQLASLPPDEVFDRNGRADAVVPWAAAHCWDYVYDGAGGWPFNTAYASAYGLDGSVRYMSSLRELEGWIRRGVPVVVSIRWDNADGDPATDLDGTSITNTNGHLMVVIGFTADGDVIANDPASPSNEEVRRIYRRDQFERNWLRASGGATYVIASP